jgi:outer membrane protein assembly factor BamA
MLKKLISSILSLIITLSVFAKEGADSVSSHIVVPKSWFVVPIGFYQEETSVGLGVTGGYYFKSNSLDRISSISGSAIYTFLNQAKININTRANFAENKVSLLGNVNLRHYVEHYYGISNDVNELFGLDGSGINVYTSQAFDVNVQPFYNFTSDISAGVYLRARGERMVKFNEPLQASIDACKQKFGTAGWDDYFMWGIGLQFMYDSRDNIFYPQKFSNFLKFNATTYSKQLGSSYSFTGINFDFRQYIPTWLGQVLAWQVKFETALGDELPFQMLPTVGGSDNIRGIRERKFIDNTMFEFQVEYRIPIWWRLKAAVFCSVGDVFDIYNPSIVKPKVGYGVGLRCRLNDARVHLRVDVAGNNYGEWKFYITATEAF